MYHTFYVKIKFLIPYYGTPVNDMKGFKKREVTKNE